MLSLNLQLNLKFSSLLLLSLVEYTISLLSALIHRTKRLLSQWKAAVNLIFPTATPTNQYDHRNLPQLSHLAELSPLVDLPWHIYPSVTYTAIQRLTSRVNPIFHSCSQDFRRFSPGVQFKVGGKLSIHTVEPSPAMKFQRTDNLPRWKFLMTLNETP